jgi:hypothetical protein
LLQMLLGIAGVDHHRYSIFVVHRCKGTK